MKFVLPYIIAGQPKARSFMEVSGFDTIQAAAASAEEQLRIKYTKILGRRVCVAVAEIDFTYRNRETGEPLPRPAQHFRRRRNQGGVWRG